MKKSIEEITFEYVGTLSRPGDYVSTNICECSKCGCLIKASGVERHKIWHAQVLYRKLTDVFP